MTAERLARPLGHRRVRGLAVWLGVTLVIVGLAGALSLRHHHVALPFHGTAAARFLEHQAGGNDQIVHARCSQSACTVWLNPIPVGAAVPRQQMYQNLAVDAYLIGNLEAPQGAVYARSWRFVLSAANGVLTADCTHAQVHRIGGRMTPTLLPGICHTNWRAT